MFRKIFYVIVAILFLQQTSSNANGQQLNEQQQNVKPDCGIVNEMYLYNRSNITALNEYPWLGRINHAGRNGVYCDGILIDKRHLIAPAHCALEWYNLNPYDVTLGNWNTSNHNDEADCTVPDNGVCAPKPQIYNLEEIAIHPNYTRTSFNNDIAIFKLNNDVTFTKYVHPICLPKPMPHAASNIDRATHLEMVGYVNSVRQKALVRTTTHAYCSEIYKSIQLKISEDHLCGYIYSNLNYTNAALMGIEVVNGIPQYAYLTGFLSFGPNENSLGLPDVFIRIIPHLDWIYENIK